MRPICRAEVGEAGGYLEGDIGRDGTHRGMGAGVSELLGLFGCSSYRTCAQSAGLKSGRPGGTWGATAQGMISVAHVFMV
jgi:hypothetical protein